MNKLIIRDGINKNGFLTVTLFKILQILEESGSATKWQICGVHEYGDQFEVVGEVAKEFEKLRNRKTLLEIEKLKSLSKKEHQLIWAEFRGFKEMSGVPAFIIRAVDSSWFDVATDDKMIMEKLVLAFEDTTTVA